MKTPFRRAVQLMLVGAAASGCVKTPSLHTEASTAAIRSAEDMGATDVPRASLHLQLAKEELSAATALNARGETEQARSMLLRAEADAELAIALSGAEDDKLEAQAAMERVRKLQAENPYSPGGGR